MVVGALLQCSMWFLGCRQQDKCLLVVPLHVVARVLWVVSRGLPCG